VDWWTVIPALGGTVVGASVTLLADRVRWRRDQHQRGHDARRDAYAAYLAALHATSEGLRAVSLGEHSVEVPRAAAARAAFRTTNLNALRELLVLLAPAPIVLRAGETFRELRNLRDVVAGSQDLDPPDYQPVLMRYQLALKRLRNSMREDLGTPSLDEDETF
jgi:hypothetical protein